MADLAASVNTDVAAAIVAFKAGDNAGALTLLRAAHMALAGIPNTERGRGAEKVLLEWDRAAIEKIIADIEGQVAGADRRRTITTTMGFG